MAAESTPVVSMLFLQASHATIATFDWLCVPECMIILDDDMLRDWAPEFAELRAMIKKPLTCILLVNVFGVLLLQVNVEAELATFSTTDPFSTHQMERRGSLNKQLVGPCVCTKV